MTRVQMCAIPISMLDAHRFLKCFFFSSRRRHTRLQGDWSSDVCSSDLCGIQDPLFDAQLDAARWPLLKLRLADVFRTRTRQQWCELLEGSDACFAPVLDWEIGRASCRERV